MSIEKNRIEKYKWKTIFNLSQSHLLKSKINKSTASRNKILSFKRSSQSMSSNSLFKNSKDSSTMTKYPIVLFRNKEICKQLLGCNNSQLNIGIKKIEFITPSNNNKNKYKNNINEINTSKLKIEYKQHSQNKQKYNSTLLDRYYEGSNFKYKKLIGACNLNYSKTKKQYKNTSIILPKINEYKYN